MKKLILFGTFGLLLAGCIPSVNPFYNEKDLVFEQRLLGEWQATNDSDQPALWRFEKLGDKAYKVIVTEEKTKQGEFTAHLFKLRKEYFLDIVPSKYEFDPNQSGLVSLGMFPGHLLLWVPQIAPELKLAPFDFDWLKKYLEENPKAIAHRKESNDIILTAAATELQRFVLEHLAEGQLFAKPGALARKSGAGSAGTEKQPQ
jgi:hypothetical protein